MTVHRAQRGEAGFELRGHELKDMFGPGEVPEAVQPQIQQVCIVGQFIADESCGRLRDEHLAPVAGSADARGPVQIDADIAFAR